MHAVRSWPWLADAAIAAVILVSGIVVGAAYRRASFDSGVPELFGQPEFGPAVSMACGRGFVDPGSGVSPALDDFLHLKNDRLACADLPASVSPTPITMTQGIYRYLMTTVALVWRISGISWSGLTPLFGVLYGLTLAAAYGVFRLLTGRVMAVVATLAVMTSVNHLESLPQLRDYAKAPFILALILIMGLIARPPLSPRRAIGLAIAFGVTLGVGFGFRNDLLITVLPWTAVVLFCLPGRVRSNLQMKAACIAVSGAAFLLLAWPILAAYSRGSNSGHVALLGFMSPFDGPLGLEPPLYSWGYTYLDGYAAALINSFTYRTSGNGVPYLSPEYDRAMVSYVLEIARHWPADLIIRAYGSVLKVIEFPFVVGGYSGTVPHGIASAAIQTFYDYQGAMLKHLRAWAVFDVAAAIAVIGAINIRAALAVLVLLVYFAGYPALQFHVRHFFHLEFIAWAALAFLIDCAALAFAAVWRSRRDLTDRAAWIRAGWTAGRMARNVAVVAVVAAILITGPVAVLRAYQTSHLRTVFSRDYLGSRREPLDVVATPAAGHRTSLTMAALWGARNPAQKIATAYLVVELSPAACDALYVQVAFKYEGEAAAYDHTIDAPLADGDQPTFVLSPVYYSQEGHFSRIEVPEEDVRCVTRVSRMVSSDIPRVLVDADFPPHWQQSTLFQTIREWETPNRGERLPHLYLSPPFGAAPRRVQLRPFVAPPDAPQSFASIARPGPGGTLVIAGTPASPDSAVTTIRDQPLEAGAVVVCRGTVRHGGVTVGLLLDNHWAKTINVATPGPFVVALTTDVTAKYSVVVSNFVLSGDNDVTISALGWQPPVTRPLSR